LSPWSERFNDSHSGAFITFRDAKRSIDGVGQRNVPMNEKQLDVYRIGEIANARVMVRYHVVHWRDVIRRQRKVFNGSAMWLLLLDEPSLRAKLRRPNEPTTARTDANVVVLFELDCIYNELSAPRMPIYVPNGSSEATLIGWKSKPTFLRLIEIVTSLESLSLRFRWKMAVREQALFCASILVFSGPPEQAVEFQRPV